MRMRLNRRATLGFLRAGGVRCGGLRQPHPVIVASQVGRFVAALMPGSAGSGLHSAWARRGGLRLRISIVQL